MVLTVLLASVLFAAESDEPSTPAEEAEPTPTVEPEASPPSPPPMPAPVASPAAPRNAVMTRGLVLSTERLLPLVSVRPEGRRRPECFPAGCSESPALSGGVAFGFDAGRAESVIELPGLGIDGVFSGVTVGTEMLMGTETTTRKELRAEPAYPQGVVRTIESHEFVVAMMPRLGYAIALGESFAVWPRVGMVATVTESSTSTLKVPVITAQVAMLWFFASHVAFTLTPTGYVPTEANVTPVRRFGLDLGIALAF